MAQDVVDELGGPVHGDTGVTLLDHGELLAQIAHPFRHGVTDTGQQLIPGHLESGARQQLCLHLGGEERDHATGEYEFDTCREVQHGYTGLGGFGDDFAVDIAAGVGEDQAGDVTIGDRIETVQCRQRVILDQVQVRRDEIKAHEGAITVFVFGETAEGEEGCARCGT